MWSTFPIPVWLTATVFQNSSQVSPPPGSHFYAPIWFACSHGTPGFHYSTHLIAYVFPGRLYIYRKTIMLLNPWIVDHCQALVSVWYIFYWIEWEVLSQILRSWVQWLDVLFIGVTQRDAGIHACPRWKVISSRFRPPIRKLLLLLKRYIWISYITIACPVNTGVADICRHSTITAQYGDLGG